MRYWIASIFTKVPVRPTAFGTVIDRKNVARFEFAGCIRDQLRAHILDDVDAVIGDQRLVHRESDLLVFAGITSTAQVSLPTATTF